MIKTATLSSILLLNLGCSSLYFLYQAGKGQARLINRAIPMEQVIEDPHTSEDLVLLLKKIPEIKIFGEQYGIKPTPNYKKYVKLESNSVVYVVTVSDELQFKAEIFDFPIVGSFNYMGWFDQQDAKNFAKKYEDQGKDVDVRGAQAYSTLGWFHDPLLSSMIAMREGHVMPGALADLVNVVIHESVHATLYIKNQSYFNEGVANYIADRLTEQYFSQKGLVLSEDWVTYQRNQKRQESVQKLLYAASARLKTLYDSKRSDEEKRQMKTQTLDQLSSDLNRLIPGMRRLNNASLIQYQTYHSSKDDFDALYKRKNEDIQVFLQALMTLKPESFERPHQEGFAGVLGQL